MPRSTSRSVFAFTCLAATVATMTVASTHADEECHLQWVAFDPLLTPSFGGPSDLVIFDDGTGPSLYADGVNPNGGVRDVAKWDGSQWSRLGSGTNGTIASMIVFDDGTGPALYVGGVFSSAGGVPARRVAKWNGTSWSALGDGPGADQHGQIRALAVFDDGTGPALYAAGNLVSDNHIVKWDGTSWSTLGEGLDDAVSTLTVFDGGSGPALYAGGGFLHAGGKPASHIAKWDGTSWSPLGSGVSQGVNSTGVYEMVVFDDGSGPSLYATGNFTVAGGNSANHIASWDGNSWSALGSGLSSRGLTLTGFDDGEGPALYVGGGFFEAGGQPVNRIAKWQEGSWFPLGPGFDRSSVTSLLVYDAGNGPSLLAGGAFTQSCFSPMNRLALWTCTSPRECSEDINRDGAVDLADLNMLLGNFGTGQICGDANDDGIVNLADLNAVLVAFGTACP